MAFVAERKATNAAYVSSRRILWIGPGVPPEATSFRVSIGFDLTTAQELTLTFGKSTGAALPSVNRDAEGTQGGEESILEDSVKRGAVQVIPEHLVNRGDS